MCSFVYTILKICKIPLIIKHIIVLYENELQIFIAFVADQCVIFCLFWKFSSLTTLRFDRLNLYTRSTYKIVYKCIFTQFLQKYIAYQRAYFKNKDLLFFKINKRLNLQKSCKTSNKWHFRLIKLIERNTVIHVLKDKERR